MRKIIVAAVIIAAIAALLGIASSRASASTSCQPGSTGHTVHWQQPGSITVWWTSLSTPRRCVYIRPEVQSSETSPYMHPEWYGGWIVDKNYAPQSTATDQDGYSLLRAWMWKNIGSSCWKKRYYPTTSGWNKLKCPSSAPGLPA